MKNEDGKITCSYRLNPDTVRRIEQWYKTNGCEHKNEFVENAVNFYVSYLTLHDNNNTLLPTAVRSVIDGRLGQFEEHMAYCCSSRRSKPTWLPRSTQRHTIGTMTRCIGSVETASET